MEFMRQYEILHKKARTDLKVAKNLLEDFNNGDDELDLEVIIFHLQQCAEKVLKSILAYNKIHFTKTHNIKVLIDASKDNSIDLIKNIEDLAPLSEYAVEGRYAIIHDDLEDTDKYIEILDKLLEFVKSEISK